MVLKLACYVIYHLKILLELLLNLCFYCMTDTFVSVPLGSLSKDMVKLQKRSKLMFYLGDRHALFHMYILS